MNQMAGIITTIITHNSHNNKLSKLSKVYNIPEWETAVDLL